MSDEKSNGKRPYTMSEAALEQRRKASLVAREHCTGPTSEEGKAVTSRNAWKHGAYSIKTKAEMWEALGMGAFLRPCKSSCHLYPCSLVKEGKTKPGGDCLDKTVYVEAFDSIMSLLQDGDIEHVHGMLASQAAGAIEILQCLRDEVTRRPVYEIPLTKKDGELVLDSAGEQIIVEAKVNPMLAHYVKLFGELGINLPELLATPKAAKALEGQKDAADAITELFGSVLGRASGGPVRRPMTIDQKPDGGA